LYDYASYGDSCTTWDGYSWVNTCYDSSYGYGGGWGGGGWVGGGWGFRRAGWGWGGW
jgi:hypothetical protein